MASRRSRPRRLLLPTLLATVLAAEITGLAIARSLTPASAPANPAAAVAETVGPRLPSGALRAHDRVSGAGALVHSGVDLTSRQASWGRSAPAVSVATAAHAQRVSTTHATSAAAHASSTPSRSSSGGSHATHYHGTNHVWIPSLGITKSVQSFPCSRSRPPDAGVYRWGCAGHNNVYLLGHAWSTFKPLHDAYVRGSLRKGMKVVYADGSGHVHTYAVIWWRVTAPTTAASWAWAPLSRPGMTLQTCVGANSAYRLMVRLTRVA